MKEPVASATRSAGRIMAAPDCKTASLQTSFADRVENELMGSALMEFALIESDWMAAIEATGVKVMGVRAMGARVLGVTHAT